MTYTDEADHIRALRETIRRFVDKELPRDLVRDWFKKKDFPREIFAKLADLGVCGLTVDETHGGSGRDLVAAVAVIEELCRRGSIMAGPFIHCAFYGGVNIMENGTPEQKAAYLPALARGEMFFAYGLSEPDVGGDLASVTTTAKLSDDKSRMTLNGTKRWCTGARFADYIYTLVRTDPALPRYKNLAFVLVPTDAPGLTIETIDHLGLDYAETTDVHLDGVEIDTEMIVGGLEAWNAGWKMLAGPALDVEKIEITATMFGIAAAAVEDAWAYAQERKQFGSVISGHQAVRHALVDAKTKLEACRHMLYHAAHLANENRPCTVETSMAKLFVAETAVEIVLACQKVMGAYGCAAEYDMERHVRDIVLMPIVGGSSNMQRNNIAARLGLAS